MGLIQCPLKPAELDWSQRENPIKAPSTYWSYLYIICTVFIILTVAVPTDITENIGFKENLRDSGGHLWTLVRSSLPKQRESWQNARDACWKSGWSRPMSPAEWKRVINVVRRSYPGNLKPKWWRALKARIWNPCLVWWKWAIYEWGWGDETGQETYRLN